MSTSDATTAHALCEAAVDYVLQHVNTIQYLLHNIEQLQERPFARERIKCLPSQRHARRDNTNDSSNSTSSIDATHLAAGYVWRRMRADCDKGDVVLLEDDAEVLRAVARDAKRHTVHAVDDGDHHDKEKEGDAHKRAASSSSSMMTRASTRYTARELEQHHKALLQHVERNVRHELIHAYDDARGYVDPDNCLHQACSEVRAARFSGDCLVGAELKRGRVDCFRGGLQCVQRRATLAVEHNALCRGFGERAVAKVLTRCYGDYEPFAAPLFALGSYGEARFDNGTLRSLSSQQQQQQHESSSSS